MWRGLGLHHVLAPLFLAFLILYLFITFVPLPDASKTGLFLKLALGTLALGLFPAFLIRKQLYPRLWISWREIDWNLALLAVVGGAAIMFAVKYSAVVLGMAATGPDAPRFLNYYGSFSLTSYEWYAMMLLITCYVYAEEVYFRGLVHPYLRGWLGIGATLVIGTIFFAYSHLIFFAPFLAMLAILSIAATFMLEKTGTLFYGFLLHASLDIMSVVFLTKEWIPHLPPVAPSLYVLLMVLVLIACLRYVQRRLRHVS